MFCSLFARVDGSKFRTVHIDLARGKLLLTVQTFCVTLGWFTSATRSEFRPEMKHIAVGCATTPVRPERVWNEARK